MAGATIFELCYIFLGIHARRYKICGSVPGAEGLVQVSVATTVPVSVTCRGAWQRYESPLQLLFSATCADLQKACQSSRQGRYPPLQFRVEASAKDLADGPGRGPNHDYSSGIRMQRCCDPVLQSRDAT